MQLDDFDLEPLLRGARYRATRIGADAGFASRVYRLEADGDSGDLPPRLVAKLSVESAREVSFYAQLGAHCLPLVPQCYAARYDEATGQCVLLLEDLDGADWGDSAAGCSVDQARAAVDTLAALHSRWWGSPALDTLAWLPRYGDFVAQLRKYGERKATFAARYADCLTTATRSMLDAIRPEHAQVLAPLATPPRTLIHVDSHIDNWAFAADRAVLFDWQRCATGCAAVDLAQLFVGGLPVDARAEHEPTLVARYHAAMQAGGVDDYPIEILQIDLRLALLRLWIGTVNGCGSDYAADWTGRQLDITRLAVCRWGALAVDYDLAGLL